MWRSTISAKASTLDVVVVPPDASQPQFPPSFSSLASQTSDSNAGPSQSLNSSSHNPSQASQMSKRRFEDVVRSSVESTIRTHDHTRSDRKPLGEVPISRVIANTEATTPFVPAERTHNVRGSASTCHAMAPPQGNHGSQPSPKRLRRPIVSAGISMTLQQVNAALARRREKIEEIDSALEMWKPSIHFSNAFGSVKVDENVLQCSIVQPNGNAVSTGDVALGDALAEGAGQPDINEAHVTDPYQEAAIEAAKRGESFFLTGSAGTGKSYVLRRVIEQLGGQGKSVAVTASTGCAAVALKGCTIHSFASVGIGNDPIDVLRKRAGTERVKGKLCIPDVLVIDEISMIDKFLFDQIEFMCSTARQDCPSSKRQKTGVPRQNHMPFGGLQVIVCGDFFQLPPVGASDPKLKYSKEKFFAFESQAWKAAINKTFVLRTVHRQADRAFVGLLNEIRYGLISEATGRVLSACSVVPWENNTELDDKGNDVLFTKLYSHRAKVLQENRMRLGTIRSEGVVYAAKDSCAPPQELGGLSIGAAMSLLDSVNVPKEVRLKVGARVICLKNVDTVRGIVNGSAGTVVGFCFSCDRFSQMREEWLRMTPEERILLKDKFGIDGLKREEVLPLSNAKMQSVIRNLVRDAGGFIEQDAPKADVVPVVRYDCGVTRPMAFEVWDVYGMRGKVAASRRQIPLALGWALSIHKSQGMTLTNVETDVEHAFDCGQVYVALSRATSAHGLRILGFDPAKVTSHRKVLNFYRDIEIAEQY